MMVVLKIRRLYLTSTDHVNFDRTVKRQHKMCQLTAEEITTTFHVHPPTNGIVFTSEENEK